MSEREVEMLEAGPCPKCGKALGTNLPGAKEQFMVHAMPTCAEFDSRDPLEFIRWVNEQNRRKLS